jgi:hypothetical protein
LISACRILLDHSHDFKPRHRDSSDEPTLVSVITEIEECL